MATIRRLELADLIAIALIVAAAAAVRVWYLSVAAENATTSSQLQVQDALPPAPASANPRGRATGTELDVLVDNLRERNQFASRPPFASQAEETAHIAPGYPYFLSLVDRVSGDADKADQLARWIQSGLGALTAGLYYITARVAFRSRTVGLIAGAFCVFHPFWIVSTAAIADGTLATFLLAFALFLGTRAGVAGGALTSLVYGLCLAALALVRAALLPFAFAALLWFMLRCRALPRGWSCAILAVLGFVNGLAPWAVRNWQIFHEPVPIVNSAYVHLWMGNNPQAEGGPMSEAAMQWALGDVGGKKLQQRLTEQTSQTERYRVLGEATLEAVRANPAGCVRQRLWAVLAFFFGEGFLKPSEVWYRSGPPTATRTFDPLPAWLGENLALVFFSPVLVMLLLGLLGWRWTYAWRESGRLLALAAVFVPLPYIASHAEVRFGPRLPLDGVLLTFAAYALACMVPGVGTSLFAGPQRIEDEEAASRRSREGRPYVSL
jgi:hypothetical protein